MGPLITDMQKGGVLFYCKRLDADRIELRQVVLKNMDEVREFVSKLGAALPDDLGDDSPDGLILPSALECAARKKFKQMETTQTSEHEFSVRGSGEERPTRAWTIGPRFLENDGDVANLADLEGFEIDKMT